MAIMYFQFCFLIHTYINDCSESHEERIISESFQIEIFYSYLFGMLFPTFIGLFDLAAFGNIVKYSGIFTELKNVF